MQQFQEVLLLTSAVMQLLWPFEWAALRPSTLKAMQGSWHNAVTSVVAIAQNLAQCYGVTTAYKDTAHWTAETIILGRCHEALTCTKPLVHCVSSDRYKLPLNQKRQHSLTKQNLMKKKKINFVTKLNKGMLSCFFEIPYILIFISRVGNLVADAKPYA